MQPLVLIFIALIILIVAIWGIQSFFPVDAGSPNPPGPWNPTLKGLLCLICVFIFLAYAIGLLTGHRWF